MEFIGSSRFLSLVSLRMEQRVRTLLVLGLSFS